MTSPFERLAVSWLPLAGATSSITVDGTTHPLEWVADGEGAWTASCPAGTFRLETEMSGGAALLRPSMRLSRPVSDLELRLVEFPEMAPDHIAGTGLKMGGGTLLRFPAQEAQEVRSFYTCTLTKDGQSVVFTMPLEQKYQNRFRGEADGAALRNFAIEYYEHNNTLTDVELDPVRIEAGCPFQLLEAYGDRMAQPRREFPPPSYGWNSWDYYRWTITEDEVLRNAEFIAKDPVLKKHVKRIIVDDGWQYCYGEWEANHFFPHGMEWLARRITDLGFEPGLWFAPAIVEPHAQIAQRDYDMLGLSEGGQPCLSYECMKRLGFILDSTVPKTRKWLTELFDRYAAMGYKYLKLDFLFYATKAPRYHDESVPHTQLVRLMLDAITPGIRGRAVIVGCNDPDLNGPKYVEAVRVGADIHALWNNVMRNTPSVATMFWANRKLWLNDPDFAVVRAVETSDDPEMMRIRPLYPYTDPEGPFSPNLEMPLAGAHVWEMEVLLSITMMTAGAVNLSDNLPCLNQLGLSMLRKLLEAPAGETGIPLDLFSAELPVTWLQKVGNQHRLLVINWTDQDAVIPVDWKRIGLAPTRVRDFWTDQISDPPKELALGPHHCKLLEF